MPEHSEAALPPYVAVGKCQGCGHRIQALRISIVGKDATPNVNPERCIYCPSIGEVVRDHA